MNGVAYSYAIYCLIPNFSSAQGKCGDNSFAARYYERRGLAVFERNPAETTARLLFERVADDIGLLVYPAKPQIVQNAAGTMLYLPIAFDGTGNFNDSEYYLYADRGWQEVESKMWIDDLRRRLPGGLEFWKGVWPNSQTMDATAALYRKGDGNCCPTGGVARIRLSIRDRRIVVDSVTVERAG